MRSEILRLETLEKYEVLGTAPDPAVNDLVALAARACNAPAAAVAFASSDRICLYSRYGITISELPLYSLPASPPLAPMQRSLAVFEVPDTRQHSGFSSEITLSNRTFRFYAAAPLVTGSGVRLGWLFVLDTPPRRLTPPQSHALAVLGRQAMTSIELNRALRMMEGFARARQRVESALTVERNFVSTVLDTVDRPRRRLRHRRAASSASTAACEAASGYDFPTLVGRYLWDKLIPESDIPTAIDHFERIRSEGFPAAFENVWLHRNGSLRRIAWSASALYDDQGQTNFIIATGIDVTVQRAAQETLRESEARYRQLVEGSLGMVCTHDLSGVLLSVNTHGAQSIGRTREQMVGHPLTDFIPEDRREPFAEYLRKVLREGDRPGPPPPPPRRRRHPRHRLPQQAHRSPWP